MFDLHGLNPLIDANNLQVVKYLDFAMCKRNNFTYNHLTSSPMNVLVFGQYSGMHFTKKNIQCAAPKSAREINAANSKTTKDIRYPNIPMES